MIEIEFKLIKVLKGWKPTRILTLLRDKWVHPKLDQDKDIFVEAKWLALDWCEYMGPDPQVEAAILKFGSPRIAYKYASQCVFGRWPEGEALIFVTLNSSASDYLQFLYKEKKFKERLPELEALIQKEPVYYEQALRSYLSYLQYSKALTEEQVNDLCKELVGKERWEL